MKHTFRTLVRYIFLGTFAANFCLASPTSAQVVLLTYNGTSAEPSSVEAGVTAGNFTSHGNVTFTMGANLSGRDKGYATSGWPTDSTPSTFNLNSISFARTAGLDEPVEIKSSGNGPDQVKLQLTLSDILNPFNIRTNTSETPLGLQHNESARFFSSALNIMAQDHLTFWITDLQVSRAVIPDSTTSALVLAPLVVGAGAVRRQTTLRRGKNL